MNQYSNNLKLITEWKLPSGEEKWDIKEKYYKSWNNDKDEYLSHMNNEFTEDKSYKPTKKIENNPVRNPSNIKGPKDNLTNQNFKEVNFVVDDEEKQNEQN